MNIRKLILLVFTVCMAVFCYGNGGKEPDVLIPYRLDGKWGFVNQRLEKVTDAEYESRRDVTRYFALVYKNDAWFVILCDGQEIKIGNKRSNPVAIGEEYFTTEELISGRDGERYKTTIHSVFEGEIAVFYDWKVDVPTYFQSLEYIDVYDCVWYNGNYINSKGLS